MPTTIYSLIKFEILNDFKAFTIAKIQPSNLNYNNKIVFAVNLNAKMSSQGLLAGLAVAKKMPFCLQTPTYHS